MATYPKQLQLFEKNVIGGDISTPSFGDKVILSDGYAVITPYTVNMIIRFLEEDYTGYITTIDHVRHEPRFRPFDTPFGDVVVIATGNVSGDQAANELIEIMRVLWDIDRDVTDNSFGYASSTLN
jgi:hypothetical protein